MPRHPGIGSVGRVIDTQPAEARNALHAIEDASRDTLAGLRRMLGALRRTDGEPIAAPLGLGDLDALIARSADAGVRVDLRWHGERRPLPPDIDLSAFRIIQEAVTNVGRHAGTDRCEVQVEQRDGELLIDVTDDGRGGPAGTGYGISGMRERVALLHGDFTAGPRPGRGFRVGARIPVPAGVR
jgi:signal transduction histidine kinase